MCDHLKAGADVSQAQANELFVAPGYHDGGSDVQPSVTVLVRCPDCNETVPVDLPVTDTSHADETF